MKKKNVKILYAVDNLDNVKTTLFVADCIPTRDMIANAIKEYDCIFEDDEECSKALESIIDNLLDRREAYFSETDFFFELTTLYCE